MADVCKANYVWTQDEFVTAKQRYYQNKFRDVFRILLKLTCAFLLLLVLFVVAISIVFPSPNPAPYWTFILTVAICIYGLIYDRVNVWIWKRKFRKRPNTDTNVEWLFAEDVIKIETVVGEATVKWQAFIKVVEFNDGFLFYTMENFFHWIPFHSLDSVECVEIVRKVIVNNRCPYILQK